MEKYLHQDASITPKVTILVFVYSLVQGTQYTTEIEKVRPNEIE